MKLYLIIALTIISIIGIFFYFKGCSGLVASIDGEPKSKMVLITGEYFYGKADKKIWRIEKSTKSYKNIINGQVDSLSWCDKHLYGYSNLTYFTINTEFNIVEYFPTRNNMQEKLNPGIKNCKAITELPALWFKNDSE